MGDDRGRRAGSLSGARKLAALMLPARARGRLLLSLVCVGALGLAAAAGAVWTLAPEWWAVPSAVSQMTGQRVPELAPPLALGSVQPAPAEDNHPLLPAPPSSIDSRTRPVVAPTPSGPLLPQRRFTVLRLGSDNDLKFAADAV